VARAITEVLADGYRAETGITVAGIFGTTGGAVAVVQLPDGAKRLLKNLDSAKLRSDLVFDLDIPGRFLRSN
jgi:hypothetical protein